MSGGCWGSRAASTSGRRTPRVLSSSRSLLVSISRANRHTTSGELLYLSVLYVPLAACFTHVHVRARHSRCECAVTCSSRFASSCSRRKVMLPLYMLTLLSFGTFEFEVDNLGDRNSSVSTYFLAAFAMLYVVGESIPKTEYLNKIDQVIILTTTSLVLIGLISFWIARIARDDSERAEEVNSASQLGLFCFYVLFNVRLFIPVMIRQQSQMRLLQQEDPVPPQVSPRPVTVSDSHAPDETGERASIKRYTVHDDAKYFTWKGLKGLN
mmetsp:Transcript_6504/g.16452  ORF Transcript_6504/g.16452 Transcript_6504/m.16452 type:complete len:268 (+) Transcript_6504:643-1446(+)